MRNVTLSHNNYYSVGEQWQVQSNGGQEGILFLEKARTTMDEQLEKMAQRKPHQTDYLY
jgi:hypothetical protein